MTQETYPRTRRLLLSAVRATGARRASESDTVVLVFAFAKASVEAVNMAISSVGGGRLEEEWVERSERRLSRPFWFGTRTGYRTPGNRVI